MYLKIRRRDGVESLTILEEGEFKVPIDGCIKIASNFAGNEITLRITFSIKMYTTIHWIPKNK